VTHAFGLTRGQQTISLRQLGLRDHDGRIHACNRLDGDVGFLLGVIMADGVHIYKIDSALVLKAAVIKNDGQAPVSLSLSEAEKGLRAELEFWARMADRIPNSPTAQ
jgi:hypothetical protein